MLLFYFKKGIVIYLFILLIHASSMDIRFNYFKIVVITKKNRVNYTPFLEKKNLILHEILESSFQKRFLAAS